MWLSPKMIYQQHGFGVTCFFSPRTRKDSLFQTPYIKVGYFGMTFQKNGIVLVTTCKMQFYRFPFDSQTCNLTFKSVQHNGENNFPCVPLLILRIKDQTCFMFNFFFFFIYFIYNKQAFCFLLNLDCVGRFIKFISKI